MALPLELYESFLAFIELGGDVLWGLVVVTVLMWTLIIERFWYVWLIHPKTVDETKKQWMARSDRSSWYARQIRSLMVSRVAQELERGIPILRSCVAVCPLLGLLGTVMGMLEVFDVMALSGNSNVRAMAAGVSAATVSTMAGMVAALSGLYFSERLHRLAKGERRRLGDLLTS